MEKHAIPQNIMDVEFKLFGSLTVRQFLSLTAGLVIAAVIYFLGLPIILSWPLMAVSVLLGIATTFMTVNGQPFGKWFGNFLSATFSSQRYVWKKTPTAPKSLNARFQNTKEVSEKRIVKKEFGVAPIAEIVSQKSIELDDQEISDLGRIDKYFEQEFEKYNSKGQAPFVKRQQERIQMNKQNLAGRVNPIGKEQQRVKVGENTSLVYSNMQNRKSRPMLSEDEIIEQKVKEILAKQKNLDPYTKTKEVENKEKELREEMRKLYDEIQELKNKSQ